MIHSKIVIRFVGFIALLIGVFLLFPALVSIIFGDTDYKQFLISSGACLILGSLLSFFVKPDLSKIRKREGYLIVAFSWLAMCIMGALPYALHYEHISVVNAVFESSSGFTTTGATTFTDIESLPHGLLFWRSLTQWIGGMGIIVFTVAIFPLLGIGGVELFVAESPGPQSDKIHPRIKEVAKRLWIIYVGLTGILCSCLFFFTEMDFFDSLNHALTTMSTGGFSTKNNSIAHFDSASCQYIILLFMFVGGMNYTVIYYVLKGRFKRAWNSLEFKSYVGFLLLTISIIFLLIVSNTNTPFELSLRNAAFQVVSIVTTTGFITSDYTTWHSGATIVFFVLLFVGACAGSTSGGIKIIRHVVFVKTALLEFKRLLHPRAYVRLKIDGNIVSGSVSTHILVFLLCYLMLFVLGSIIMMVVLSSSDEPFLSAIGSVATSLGNVGPAIGSVGPADNFAHIPDVGKLFLALLMVIGRLEVFTILIIVSPYFWKTN